MRYRRKISIHEVAARAGDRYRNTLYVLCASTALTIGSIGVAFAAVL